METNRAAAAPLCVLVLVLLLCPGALLLLSHPADAPAPRRVIEPAAPGQPPGDAIVLFDGKDLWRWRGPGGEPKWRVADGAVTVVPRSGDLTTRDAYGDIQLHLEWRIPEGVQGDGESRGNSGIKLHEAYEIQILDSFGPVTNSLTQAGAVYKQHAPLVNVCRKPGEWQSFDIVFRSPRFDAAGNLAKHGTFTVFHNGVLIHDRVKILGRTNSTQPVKPALKQPFFLQDHGAAVSFRNIWLRELEAETE